MDLNILFNKLMTPIKWAYNKAVATIKWNVDQTIKFVIWNKETISAVWQWIVKYVQLVGRFWYGIIFMTVGAKLASTNVDAVMKFLQGQITEGNFLFGIFLIAIGLVCVIYSADYSKFRLWGDNK
jgi:hypothetical protein